MFFANFPSKVSIAGCLAWHDVVLCDKFFCLPQKIIFGLEATTVVLTQVPWDKLLGHESQIGLVCLYVSVYERVCGYMCCVCMYMFVCVCICVCSYYMLLDFNLSDTLVS